MRDAADEILRRSQIMSLTKWQKDGCMSKNARRIRMITTEHGEMPLVKFWRDSHSVVSYRTFVFRCEHGWSMIDALYIPARKCKKTA